MALPISASDMLKILEAVPGWKAVIGLPKRLADLEARVKALEENKAQHSGPNPKECPKCGAIMRVEDETPDRTFGDMGVLTHHMVCDGCGNTAERRWTAAKGYH